MFNQNEKRAVAELNCPNSHIFHVECIIKWTEKNKDCPLCKKPIEEVSESGSSDDESSPGSMSGERNDTREALNDKQ